MNINTQNEAEFLEAVKTWTRAEELSVLRAAGFTAHKIKSDDELTSALMLLRRRNQVVHSTDCDCSDCITETLKWDAEQYQYREACEENAKR
jgi:hypothetical protein